MARPILIVPGLGGSGPEHWQSLWQSSLPNATRVEQADWDRPDRAGWIAALDAEIAAVSAPPVLVAHSLSCALVACWAAAHRRKVHGALLVGPADVDSDAHTPVEAHVFRPMPMARLPFPSIVVASLIYDWTPMLKEIIAEMNKGVYGGKAYVINLKNKGQVMEFNPGYSLNADVKKLADDTVAGIISGGSRENR